MMPTTPLGTRLTSTRVSPGHDADAPGVEALVGRTGVVASSQRECATSTVRVLAGLARLQHDEVDDLVLTVEHQVVQAQEHGGAVVEGGARPGGLRAASAGEGLGDVGEARLGDVRERRAADRRGDRNGLTGRADDAPGEAGDVLRSRP